MHLTETPALLSPLIKTASSSFLLSLRKIDELVLCFFDDQKKAYGIKIAAPSRSHQPRKCAEKPLLPSTTKEL